MWHEFIECFFILYFWNCFSKQIRFTTACWWNQAECRVLWKVWESWQHSSLFYSNSDKPEVFHFKNKYQWHSEQPSKRMCRFPVICSTQPDWGEDIDFNPTHTLSALITLWVTWWVLFFLIWTVWLWNTVRCSDKMMEHRKWEQSVVKVAATGWHKTGEKLQIL